MIHAIKNRDVTKIQRKEEITQNIKDGISWRPKTQLFPFKSKHRALIWFGILSLFFARFLYQFAPRLKTLVALAMQLGQSDQMIPASVWSYRTLSEFNLSLLDSSNQIKYCQMKQGSEPRLILIYHDWIHHHHQHHQMR